MRGALFETWGVELTGGRSSAALAPVQIRRQQQQRQLLGEKEQAHPLSPRPAWPSGRASFVTAHLRRNQAVLAHGGPSPPQRTPGWPCWRPPASRLPASPPDPSRTGEGSRDLAKEPGGRGPGGIIAGSLAQAPLGASRGPNWITHILLHGFVSRFNGSPLKSSPLALNLVGSHHHCQSCRRNPGISFTEA